MKVFITGASGYVGGSVATRLVEQGHDVVGLVRTSEKAAMLEARGIEPLIGTLESAEALEAGALQCDATINAANSDHFFAARVLIDALTGTGKTLIHTSGSSIVCDDAGGKCSTNKIFDDDARFTPRSHRAPRVEIDRMVREAGIRKGIRSSVICPTMIYGRGLGIQPESDQLPKLFAKSRELNAGVYIGKGASTWSNVYIGDVADLYSLVLEKAPSASFYFAENGEATFREIAEAISGSLGFDGRTIAWDYNDAVAELGAFARIALATNARVRSKNARLLGWEPKGPSLRDALLAGK